jgi:hypothetical protein
MGLLRRTLIGAVLAALASAGVAIGAELALGDPGSLLPSDPPSLLGPITESGRVGWNCVPERAARARDAATAELPEH